MKVLFWLALVLVSASQVWAVGGESCIDATVITCLPYSDNGSTSGHVNSYDGPCAGSSASPDVVYAYTPPVTQATRWSLCTASFDTKLYIYAVTCSGTPTACNDNNSLCGLFSTRSMISSVNLVGGITYYIVVDGSGGTNGAYQLTGDVIGCNPDFTLSAPGAISGNTCNAGNDCDLRPSTEQIVRVSIPVAHSYRVSLCNSPANWNSYIYVRDCCYSNIIAENDFGNCGLFHEGLSSLYCVYLEACSYDVIIEGSSSSDCGAWTLSVDSVCSSPVATLNGPGTASGNTCQACNNCNSLP